MKTIFALVATILIIISFPQNAFAEYYNTNGELILPADKQPPKLPYGVGLNLKDRKKATNSYNYIIENECKTLAVNLYMGETLYSCPNGVKFWSDVSIEPFIMTKNRKKDNDERELDDATMSAAIYSSILMMN